MYTSIPWHTLGCQGTVRNLVVLPDVSSRIELWLSGLAASPLTQRAIVCSQRVVKNKDLGLKGKLFLRRKKEE